tara:strand:+ start:112 stop:402 length:291 start_codon:yes stop_codon:yes gene_type:complete
MKNLNNWKEYTTEEFEAKLIEVATKNARKEVKKLHNIAKVKGWNSEAGREAMLKESKLYADFLEKYGENNLIIMKIGKASQFGKSLNSKGSGFGNF